MKTLLLFFVSFFLILSCQSNKKAAIQEEEGEAFAEEGTDTVEQATAIFWLDKNQREVEDPVIRTAKAKVNILDNGRVEFKSFLKDQPAKVQRYLRYKLESFRVTKIMMDSGFIKTGEQYVQLRYRRGLANKFK